MNPQTLQLINTVAAAVIVAALIGIARWVAGKADKAELAKVEAKADAGADKAELAKLEVKLDAALLIVGAAITRPELAEKLVALSGRSDDKTQRILADIVQLFTDTKANAKTSAEIDKRLDDIPGRVRMLEENQKRG